jgi:hypothetical protein
MKLQKFVNGRGVEGDPGKGKLSRSAGRGFVSSVGRNHAPAVFYLVIFALMLILLSPQAAEAENGRGYLEVSGGYKTGDFGTPIRTNLFSITPTLGYVSTDYDVSATIPYLFLENSGATQAGLMHAESGVGDVILRGGRVLIPESKSGFSLDGSLALKLPTADEAKGLGTGETDYGAFLGGHQRFDAFKLSLLAGYIKVGDPPSIDYNDIYLYGIGLSRIFGSTELYTSFEGRRTTVPGAQDPQEVNAGFFHVLNIDYAIKGGVFGGLNNGGPDFGLNFGIVRWF